MTEGGVAIADTFAEAFPMTAARAIVTADTAGVGRDRRPDDVRVRDERDRLRRRGGRRAGARARRDAGWPARRERPALRVQPRCAREGAGQPGWPVRDDLPDHGLLQRAAAGREDHQRRRAAPLLRRRLADREAARGAAVLANPRDGRRVHLRGDVRNGQGGRGGQHHPARYRGGGNAGVHHGGRRRRCGPAPT